MGNLFRTYQGNMELKDYQKTVIDRLEKYLKSAKESPAKNPAKTAFIEIVEKPYHILAENMPNVSFICIKVPTGGGKTLLASHSVGKIYDHYLLEKDYKGLVVWFVPSDTIRTQTLNSLKDKMHPYRYAIDEYFDNKVVVLDNKEALSVRISDIKDNVCIIVSTLAAFKREDTEGLKAYEDNGGLMQHFEGLEAEEKEKTTKSLFEVIRMNNPLIIIDEGHNAKTWLSLDLITQMNPCFVLEFTATPIENKSNVIIGVPAYALKEEQMVKLPINLKNETHWETTLKAAVEKRNELEKIASDEERLSGEYIRPIVLIQAEQEKESEKKIHVRQIKDYLINELNIPDNQVAIKTGKEDDLEGLDLFSPLCTVKYIITRDAIKEGWDCSFAYVLASVFNVGSAISVEQLIGRILRLP